MLNLVLLVNFAEFEPEKQALSPFDTSVEFSQLKYPANFHK